MTAATAQCLLLLDKLLPRRLVGMKLRSSESKNLFRILEMMPAKKIQKSSITAADINIFSDVNVFFDSYLKTKTIENWCDLFDKLINEKDLKLLNEIYFYSSKFLSYSFWDQRDVLEKLRTLLSTYKEFDKIPNHEKLTLREYYIYDTLYHINQIRSKLGKHILANPLPLAEDAILLEKVDSYNERKNKAAIRVCIVRPRHAHITLFKGGIKMWLWNQLFKLTGNQGHMNFLIQNENECSAAGLSGRGSYNKPISGRKIPFFDEFKIRIKPLIPEDSSVEPKKFKSTFVDKLNETLKIKVQGLCPAPFGLLSRAPAVKTDPQKLNFAKTKMHLCSQYVCQAIIHAHIQTCNEFGITPPDSLSFYGLDDQQRMETLTPNRVQAAFIKSGIFKRTDAVLWQQEMKLPEKKKHKPSTVRLKGEVENPPRPKNMNPNSL